MNLKKLLFVTVILSAATAHAESVDLNSANFKHITFDGINANTFRNLPDKSLRITVDKSSSFLLKAFDKVTPIKNLTLVWSHKGNVKTKSAEQEASKDGDDQFLRIGFMHSGKAPSIPFFAPSWIKVIKKHMKLPSDKLTYFVAGAKHAKGQSWESPYSDTMRLISVKGEKTKNNDEKIVVNLTKPIDAVGLWIMADGDNTQSSFTSTLKSLSFND